MNEFNSLFVPVELAKPLKDLGLNLPVLGYWLPNPDFIMGEKYDWVPKDHSVGRNTYSVDRLYKMGSYPNTIPAPLYQQVFDWLYEKELLVRDFYLGELKIWGWEVYDLQISKVVPHIIMGGEEGLGYFNNKRDAWDLAITEAIKLLNHAR